MVPAILVALVFLASIVTCHVIAKRRGSSPVFWGVMGALFGPLAIPFVLISGKNRTKTDVVQ